MRQARLILMLFLVFQAVDGLITYEVAALFGPSAEANQLLAIWIGVAGLGPALFGAKLMASGCGMILYRCGAHTALASVTGLYLVGAVLPWLHVLSVS